MGTITPLPTRGDGHRYSWASHPSARVAGPRSTLSIGPRVLRLCSVFEPPASSLSRAAFDPVGGMQVHTGELTRALDALGIAQTIVTTRVPGVSLTEGIGLRSRVIRLGLGVPFLRQLYAVPASVVSQVVARRSDLVHVHLGEDLSILPIGLAAARLHDVPLVLSIHCSLRHTLAPVDLRAAILRTVGGAIEERVTRAADEIVVLSRRLASRLSADGVDPDRIHVLPPALDRRAFAVVHDDPVPDVPRPRILFVGRLVPAKGADTLIRAASRMAGQPHLVVVGDGPQRRALERLAARVGMASRTRFTGFVEHEAIPAFLQHADVLAFPSTYEELGRTLVEAATAGVPIVASRTGGIPEVVEHGENGLLVRPGRADELAAALTRVLGDDRLRAAMRRAASRRRSSLDWSGMAREMIALYQRALEPDRRRS